MHGNAPDLNDGDGSADAPEPASAMLATCTVCGLPIQGNDLVHGSKMNGFVHSIKCAPEPVDFDLPRSDRDLGAALAAMWAGCEYLASTGDEKIGLFGREIYWNAGDLAAFIRKLGRERARPDVVAQQMKILGLIPSAEISAADRLVLDLFTHTLTTIDAFAAEEAARIAAEKLAAERQAPAPLPIEDTTMEPVSGTMDTW